MGGALGEVGGSIEGNLEDGAIGLLLRLANRDKLGDALGDAAGHTLGDVEGDAVGEVEGGAMGEGECNMG